MVKEQKERIVKVVHRHMDAFMDELSDEEFASREWLDDFFEHVRQAILHWEEFDG